MEHGCIKGIQSPFNYGEESKTPNQIIRVKLSKNEIVHPNTIFSGKT